MNKLEQYGVTDNFLEQAEQFDNNLKLARVIAQYKGLYKIITEEKETLATISGKLRFETEELAKYPAVGDFVMVSNENDERAIIHNILERESIFARTAVGVKQQAQIIATNINTVFICMSLNNNYNLSRLERYMSIAWDSGATPVVVLTKSDLCDDLVEKLQEVESVAFCDILLTSMYDNDIEQFEKYISKQTTVAFIGSSGVGKSTLINKLLSEDKIETKEISKGDKGRHTTTGREMFKCSFGGVLIDTPGMREIGVQTVDLSKSFEDIEELTKQCKFNDCTHTNEPKCAVLEAVENGSVDSRRLQNYFKLQNESSYEGLNSKQIEEKKFERMFKEVGGMKNVRRVLKEKNKRR